MIFVSRKELEGLEYKRGAYAKVYRYGDKAYKIYHDKVKVTSYDYRINPILFHSVKSLIRCNRLIKLRDKIQNTDLIEDTIFIGTRFYGVVMPYYDGLLLVDIRNKPLEYRMAIIYKIVNKVRELTNHYIYHLDYGLFNIIVVDDDPKIFDLDDDKTKVKMFENPRLLNDSVILLSKTIKEFIGEFDYELYSDKLKEVVNKKEYKNNTSYEEIEEYLRNRSIKENLIFINDESVVDNINFDNLKVIYIKSVYDTDELVSRINKFRSRGIVINDVIPMHKMDNYINDYFHDDVLYVEKDKVLSLK